MLDPINLKKRLFPIRTSKIIQKYFPEHKSIVKMPESQESIYLPAKHV